jgi:guanylate kinase
MARLVIISGPSGIGKSPLLRTLQRFHPDLAARLQPLVLYNDRAPRPGEQDGVAYHFRTRAQIEALRAQPGHIILPVRRDLQALDMAQVQAVLAADRDPLFEGNPYIAHALLSAPELAQTPKVAVFLSPVSLDEVRELLGQSADEARRVVTDIMRRKLLRRTQRQKGLLSGADLDDIEARCGAAYDELRYTPQFDWVLPNHDGEDSENWEAFGRPVGDARRCLVQMAALLRGEAPVGAEQWPAELFA